MNSQAAERTISAFTAWRTVSYRLRNKCVILVFMYENTQNLLEFISIAKYFNQSMPYCPVLYTRFNKLI